ncbi:MAG: KEOPS complex subunit Cgi121 [Candidatus Thermoplasmatota archaeon]|nr:KEOPS complex subunit Cgi121 [Candidatus Thermoplasmatota archaeon]
MIDYNLKVFGCKGRISSVNNFIEQVNDFEIRHKICIQLMDATLVFGKDHIISAFEHAKRAMKQNSASTHSFEMELLLYASGERQIKHAISKMGLKKNNTSFVIIFLFNEQIKKQINIIFDIFLQTFNLRKDDSVLEADESMLTEFGIAKQAIASVRKDQLVQLVLEKVALVDIIK